MAPAELFHYLHILVFAIIAGVEVPAAYALRLARAPGADAGAVALAVKLKRGTESVSALMLVLMLPLGVHIATDIGVYTLMSPGWLTSTWIVGAVWFALALAAVVAGSPETRRRLQATEAVIRIIIGLGNIYDAVVGFMGTGMIQTNWLATKILLFGVILVISGWLRWRTRTMVTADLTGGGASAALAQVRSLQWASHSILALVLVAAFMGTVKPW